MKKTSHSRVRAVLVGAGALVLTGGVGGATAARLIDSADIVDQSVRSVDIATQGVGTSEVRNGSLMLRDISDTTRAALRGATGADGAAGAQGPAGPQGDPGADGAPGADGDDGADGATGPAGTDGVDGATGPAGAAGTDGVDGVDGVTGYQIVTSSLQPISAGAVESAQVSCPTGKRVLGGGGDASSAAIALSVSRPISATAWQVYYLNNGGGSGNIEAWAVCANVG